MTPKNHYSADAKWLEDRFGELCGLCGVKAAMSVFDKYSAVYAYAHDKEPVQHKKDGAARREANSRLVAVIKNLRKK